MVSNPPDAIATTKPTRQSDTSESSDDDQPTPAKKMKQEETKGKYYMYNIYIPYYKTKIITSFNCSYSTQRRGRKGK